MLDDVLDETYEYSESYGIHGDLNKVSVTFEDNYVKFEMRDGELVFTYVDTSGFEESVSLVRKATEVVEVHDFEAVTPLNE